MVSDSLNRLHEAAARLLGMVDETLARCGAPERHPIWPLLRTVGLLPGDAVSEVAALSLEAFRERAGLMRSHDVRCGSIDDLVTGSSTWEGSAAEAAGARLEAARVGLRVITRNAGVLRGVLEDLAEWGEQGRLRLARTLARVLTSAEAVELTLDPVADEVESRVVDDGELLARVRAAADIGAEVLAEVARFWAGAREVAGERLSGLEAQPVESSGPTASGGRGGRLAVEF